jgi:outer membrane protein OmpA-like peptidoglycan-associated protein
MKHVFLWTLCGILLIQGNASAQETDYSHWSLGMRLGLNRAEYVGGILSTKGFGFTFGVEAERTFNPLWGLAAAYDYLGYSYNNVNGNAHELTGLATLNMSNLVARYRKGEWQKVNVYGRLGAGFSLVSAAVNAKTVVMPMGASIEYNISPQLAVNVTGDRRWHMSSTMGFAKAVQERAVHWAGTVGLRYKFGNSSRPHIRNTGIVDYEAPYLQYFYAVPVRGEAAGLPEPEITLVESEEIAPELEDVTPEPEGMEPEVLPEPDATVEEYKETAEPEYDAYEALASRFGNSLVEYELDSYDISDSFRQNVDGLAAALEVNPDAKIEIIGHTDDSGEEDFNKMLSLKRAGIVKDYLVEKGVDPAKIITKGVADTQPLVPNTTLEGRRKNRRVDVRFLTGK